jgi:N-acyl-D-amino-acid deacylase
MGVGIRPFDRIIEEIMEEHEIAGVTMAIAQDGRLVLAKGYGLADVERNEPVTPSTLFSLASVTKSVTAVAALKLVDEGKLNLETRLVDALSDLKPLGDKRVADPRFREITVHHLLYHAAGFDHDGPRPEETPHAARGEELESGSSESIENAYRVAMTKPLEYAPGTEHHYSNFGFVVARLVIERAARQPYEPFVREHILKPMGISGMVMETDRYIPEETKRYVRGPKGTHIARHAPANWLATPSDMARFLTAIAGTRGKRFLSERSTDLMLAPPPPPIRPTPRGNYVGLGFDSVKRTPEGYRFSKNGGKAGVSSWIEHLPNGVDWAFMLNTTIAGGDDSNAPNPAREIIQRIDEEASRFTDWPEINLFRS